MTSDADCVFCRIVAGEIPAQVVRETEHTLAFPDVSPQAPVHVLVVPKEHVADLDSVVAADPGLAGELLRECAAVADQLGVGGRYRVVTNIGAEGGQGVFHCHLHVLAGRQMSDALG